MCDNELESHGTRSLGLMGGLNILHTSKLGYVLFMCELCHILSQEIVRGFFYILSKWLCRIFVGIMCDLCVMLSLEIVKSLNLYGYFQNGICGIYE